MAYKHEVLSQVKADLLETMDNSFEATDELVKNTIPQRIISALVRVFSPML